MHRAAQLVQGWVPGLNLRRTAHTLNNLPVALVAAAAGVVAGTVHSAVAVDEAAGIDPVAGNVVVDSLLGVVVAAAAVDVGEAGAAGTLRTPLVAVAGHNH